MLTGKKISNYEIGSLIAKGRTGMVYKARMLATVRTSPSRCCTPISPATKRTCSGSSPMTTVCELKHPNLIALYGAGKQGDTCWLAMEFVDGEPLTKVIERIGTLKMLEWKFALGVGVHIAQASRPRMKSTSFIATSRPKAS